MYKRNKTKEERAADMQAKRTNHTVDEHLEYLRRKRENYHKSYRAGVLHYDGKLYGGKEPTLGTNGKYDSEYGECRSGKNKWYQLHKQKESELADADQGGGAGKGVESEEDSDYDYSIWDH